MTTATTQIVITAKDSTAAAFASVNSGLTGLSGTAARLGSTLSALGAGAFVGSLASFTRQTLEAQDQLFKLSQKTGLAVESLAGLEFAAEQSGVELEKVARATRVFRELVIEAGDSSSTAAKQLKSLGLSYQDLKDLSPEKQLLALADALSKFSKQDQAVAFTSVFGQKMADLIPLLSGGSKNLAELIEQGKKLNPVTEQSARQAERFNDQLNLLNKSVSALGREFVQGMIPGLTAVADKMVQVTQQSGFLAGALAGVKELFVQSFGNPKILGDVGQIRREILKTQETIAQMSTKKDSIFFDRNALEHEKEKLAQLEIDLQKAIGRSREIISAQDANTESTKKFAIALEDANKPVARRAAGVDSLTKKINDQSRIESEYIKLLKIERQAQQDLLKPYQQSARSAEERLQSMRQENQAMQLARTRQISLEEAIELTTIARLEEQKVIAKDTNAVAAINQEIAARKQMVGIIQSNEARNAGNKIREAELQAYEQFSIQAARNIQTNLAFGIEEGFRNGFKSGVRGLLDGLVNTVSNVISQVLAAKLLQSTGLGASLGLFGGGIGGTGSTSNALNAASLGVNAASFIKSGFGLNSFIGGGIQSLGTFTGAGRLAAFGGGFAGDSLGGLAAGGFTRGAATAANLGSTAGALAGPIAIGMAIVEGLKAAAGNKRLGGGFGDAMNFVGDIPILGNLIPIIPIINGLFGRGPLKQKSTTLSGTIGAEGFTAGALQTDFVAKGGLFRSNKNDFARVDAVTGQVSTDNKKLTEFANQLSKASKDIIGLINETTLSTTKNLRLIAGDLKLSTAGLEAFNHEINLTSENGKGLTEEQIGAEIEKISDSLARSLIPEIDNLAKRGETAMQAVSRLGLEFESLVSAGVLLGSTLDDARRFILSASFDQRTAFVDAAGGIDALGQKAAFFADNFLTEAERIAPVSQRITEELGKLGIAGDITKEQFKQLVQSFGAVNGVTQETLQALLNLAPAFVQVRNYSEELARAERERAEQERQRILQEKERHFAEARRFGDEISRGNDVRRQSIINGLLKTADNALAAINTHLSKLRSLSDAIKSATQSLSPQRIEEARNNIMSALSFDRRGNVNGIKDINLIDQQSIATLSSQSSAGFSSRDDFIRSQSINLQILNLLARATNRSIFGEIGAANAFQRERNKIPSFDVGGVVPKTGIALVHKGERVINPQQNEAIVKLLQDVVNAVKSGSVYSQNTFTLLRDMTNDGLALNTRAAV